MRQDGCTCGVSTAPPDGSHLPGCPVVPMVRPEPAPTPQDMAGSGSRVEAHPRPHVQVAGVGGICAGCGKAWPCPEARRTPPPAVDGTRCAWTGPVCGEPESDLRHVYHPDMEMGRYSHPFTPPAPDPGSRVERVRQEQAAGGGPVTAVMVSRSDEVPPALVPSRHGKPEDEATCEVCTDADADAHCFTTPSSDYCRFCGHRARPTPPPAVDGTRCAECGADEGFVMHGGVVGWTGPIHPFVPLNPPAPDPDRLRALEALQRIHDEHYESVVRKGWCSDCATRWPCWTRKTAARALLATDGRTTSPGRRR